jgi:hypothetical protein
MILAGVPVDTEHVQLLARMLHRKDPLGRRLALAVEQREPVVALTIAERARLLAALDPPPQQLATLYEALLDQARRRATQAAGEAQRKTSREGRLRYPPR